MNLIKYVVIFCLSFFIWACRTTTTAGDDGVLNIDIGDCEAQLAAWNSLNILDYQLVILDNPHPWIRESVVINVRNGIPEDSELPIWLGTQQTTIPGIFSYIKKKKKEMRNWPKNRYKAASFYVYYQSELHYPIYIGTRVIYDNSPEVNGAYSSGSLRITLTPMGENE
jgi:hypothetical protein